MKNILLKLFMLSIPFIFMGCHHDPKPDMLVSYSETNTNLSKNVNSQMCDSCNDDVDVVKNIIKVPVEEKTKAVKVVNYTSNCNSCGFPVTVRVKGE